MAAPVDAYVRPGLPGPKLDNFNWQALGQLSSTLAEYANAVDQRQAQLARTITPEIAAKAPKALLPILRGDDELTKEHLQQLADAGITGVDNPYGVMALRQASAIQAVRDTKFRDALHEPQWFETYVRTSMDNPAAAEGMKQERIKAGIAALGEMPSPIAQQAAQQEILREVERFDAAVAQQKPKVFSELKQRETSTILGTVIENEREAILGIQDKAARAERIAGGTKVLKEWIESQRLIMGASQAEDAVFQALEPALLATVKTDGPYALHFLDRIRESWGGSDSITAMKFDALEAKISKAVQEQDYTSYRGAERGRTVAHSRISRAMAEIEAAQGPQTDDYWREWFYKGPGNDLINQAMIENKAEADLAGDIREDWIQKARSRRLNDREQDDPKLVHEVQMMIRRGDHELADARIMALSEGGDISPNGAGRLWQMLEQDKARGFNSPENRTARNQDFEGFFSSLGTLPPEAGPEASNLRYAFEAAYNESLAAKPGDYALANQQASKAARASDSYKRLTELRTQDTWEFLRSQPDYVNNISGVVTKVVDSEWDRQVKANPEADFMDFYAKRGILMTQVETQAQRLYEAAKQDPALMALPVSQRNVRIMEKLRGELPAMLKAAKNLDTEKTKSSVVDAQRAAEYNNDRQLMNLDDQGGLDMVDPKTIIRPSGIEDGWITYGAYSHNAMGMQEYLSTLRSGGSNSQWVAMPTAQQLADMEIVLSARLVDSASATSREAAGDNRWGDMLRTAPNRTATRSALKATIISRGLTLAEVQAGQTRAGVPFSELFSEGERPWRETFPARQIALFDTVESLNKAAADLKEKAEESELGKTLQSLGLDPNNKTTVETFLMWQTDLVATREGARISDQQTLDRQWAGYDRTKGDVQFARPAVKERVRQYLYEPADFTGIGPWAAKRVAAYNQFMEKLNGK